MGFCFDSAEAEIKAAKSSTDSNCSVELSLSNTKNLSPAAICTSEYSLKSIAIVLAVAPSNVPPALIPSPAVSAAFVVAPVTVAVPPAAIEISPPIFANIESSRFKKPLQKYHLGKK